MQRGSDFVFHNNPIVFPNALPPSAYVPQVQDEAVPLVEAIPADCHLRRPHSAATLDLEKPLDNHLVGDDVLEPGGHAPLLRDKSLKGLKC